MKNSMAAKVILAALWMVVFVLDTKTALRGASDGIESCISTVIPSLLPFIFLSCLINDHMAGAEGLIPKSITKAAGLPEGTGNILISAVLGGYPAGAQAVRSAYSNGILKKPDAERILAYCNNAGPAFIFGITGHLFPSRSAPWLLWSIHIISAFAVRLLIGMSYETVCADVRTSRRPADIALHTAKIMCTICTWVIIFKVILTYLDAWTGSWIPPAVRTVLFGVLELVNGCCALPGVPDLRVRFVMLSGMLAFGGVCITMQTLSVAKGLSIRYYLKGKMLQTVFSIIISASLVYQRWYMLTVFLVPAILFKLRHKNKGRNMVGIGV